jgi:hypothetical protein
MSPIPEYIHVTSDSDALFYIRAEWKLCRVIWPQRCEISGRRLWPGTWAYRGRAMYTGPGEPVFETRWHDCAEHIIWQLKE